MSKFSVYALEATASGDYDVLIYDSSEGLAANQIKRIGIDTLLAGSLDANFDNVIIDELGTATTPASGKVRLYAKADGKLYFKDDAGTETEISGVTASSTDTFTNKTLIASSNTIEELTTTASSATPTPTGGSLLNRLTVTALAAAAELQAPSGTPADGHRLMVRWLDDGTNRALTYNAIYRGIAATLASTTTANKTLYQEFIYNSADSKWDLILQVEEA